MAAFSCAADEKRIVEKTKHLQEDANNYIGFVRNLDKHNSEMEAV